MYNLIPTVDKKQYQRSVCSPSVKHVIDILVRIPLNPQIALSSIHILMMAILLIHEQGVCFHLFVSSSSSFFNFLLFSNCTHTCAHSPSHTLTDSYSHPHSGLARHHVGFLPQITQFFRIDFKITDQNYNTVIIKTIKI